MPRIQAEIGRYTERRQREVVLKRVLIPRVGAGGPTKC